MNKYNLAHEFIYWRNHNEKNILFGLCLVGITLNSANSLAVNKANYYPATNIQPKIIFIDKEAARTSPIKAEFDLKYPAANFPPKVLYSDKNTTGSNK